MTQPIFILGTGGHARDVASVADALGWRPVFVTRDLAERQGWKGADEIVLEHDVTGVANAAFAIGVGDNEIRAHIAARYDGLYYPALVHPDTSFGRGQRSIVETARGTIIFPGARFTSNIRVGAFCTFNLNVTVSHDCEIGDFVNLSPGASIAGNVRIADGAWIGMGAVVHQGSDLRKLEIGPKAIVGSGAVVLSDCAANSVYVGVPARILS